VTIILVGAALLELAGWGAATSQVLAATQSALTSTEQRLEATADELGDTIARNVQLDGQVARQESCIDAQQAIHNEMVRITALRIENFNRVAEGSAFNTAYRSYEAANSAATDAYYNATSAAWDGLYGAANDWIATGNSQISTANGAVQIMETQIAIANEATAQIEADEAALDAQIQDSATTCGFLIAPGEAA
jgi:hypothetical protein